MRRVSQMQRPSVNNAGSKNTMSYASRLNFKRSVPAEKINFLSLSHA